MNEISYQDVSIVLPAYNEESTLKKTVEKIISEVGEQAEIIIVEDGCTDKTPEIASQLESEHSQIKHIHYEHRQGKATAIKKAFDHTQREILVFADSDTPSAFKNISRLVKEIREGNDLVIGNRHTKDSEAKRGLLRRIHTTYTNKTISKILGTGVNDHQCGFKAIKKDKYEEFKPRLKSEAWFLDIELIHYSQKQGHKIQQVPVHYSREDESSSAGIEIFTEFFKVIYRLKKEDSKNMKRLDQYAKFGTIGALGAVINTVALFALTEYLNLYYMLSGVISTELAIIFMFLMNNKYTFKPIKKGIKQLAYGLAKSNLVRSVGIILQLGLLFIITEYLNIWYIISNLIAIVVASIATFYGEKHYNWNTKENKS